MRIPQDQDDDFIFTAAETASLLGKMAKDIYAIGAMQESGTADISSRMEKENGRGQSKRFFSLRSILEYSVRYRIPLSVSSLQRITDNQSILERFNTTAGSLGISVSHSTEKAIPLRREVEDSSLMERMIEERDERIADLQTRLDETQGKYETILVESGEKQQALLLQRVGVEKALSGMIYKAQKAEPQLRFIEQKDERGVIVDVEVVKDTVKSFPWPYVWGAVSTVALLGVGVYLVITTRIFG